MNTWSVGVILAACPTCVLALPAKVISALCANAAPRQATVVMPEKYRGAHRNKQGGPHRSQAEAERWGMGAAKPPIPATFRPAKLPLDRIHHQVHIWAHVHDRASLSRDQHSRRNVSHLPPSTPNPDCEQRYRNYQRGPLADLSEFGMRLHG